MSNYINHYDYCRFHALFGELFGAQGIAWNQYLMRYTDRGEKLEIQSASLSSGVSMEIKSRARGDFWISIYEKSDLLVSLSWRGRIGNLQWLIEDGIQAFEFHKEFLDAIKSCRTTQERRDLLGLHHGGSTGDHKLDDLEFTNQLKLRPADCGPQFLAQFEESDQ